jgi:hypothetical protein
MVSKQGARGERSKYGAQPAHNEAKVEGAGTQGEAKTDGQGGYQKEGRCILEEEDEAQDGRKVITELLYFKEFIPSV